MWLLRTSPIFFKVFWVRKLSWLWSKLLPIFSGFKKPSYLSCSLPKIYLLSYMFSIPAQMDWMTKEALCYENSCLFPGWQLLIQGQQRFPSGPFSAFWTLLWSYHQNIKSSFKIVIAINSRSMAPWCSLSSSWQANIYKYLHSSFDLILVSLFWGRDEVSLRLFISYVWQWNFAKTF